jgi:glutamyl-tRNA synthetase
MELITMVETVRTRFAPSPTGFMHVGSLHSALFAWLFARHNNGSFILRIEDTDVARTVEGSADAILEGFRWFDLDWDEGPEVGGPYAPYFQSQRLELYRAAAERLIASGHAYKCYCSEERLEKMRELQRQRKQPPGYDRHCRDLNDEEKARLEASGTIPVVRFKIPFAGETKFHDIIWGDVTFKNSLLDDHVMLKSDGFPTYQLANVVDDHEMKITHVIRAEEWLSSTPRHVLEYNALVYELPQFAHLPLLIGSDRSKLSKRHGSVHVGEFQAEGYLPEAMMNFLATLGWSLDDKTELFTREDLIKYFSLERVSKTPAIFNREKLNWMNGLYVRKLSPEDFARRAVPFLERDLPPEVKRPLSPDYLKEVLPLVQERVKLMKDVTPLSYYFFTEALTYDTALLVGKDMTAESTINTLEVAGNRLAKLDTFDAPTLEGMLRPLAVELGLKTGQLFGALRTAVSGETATPPLFQMMAVLGKDRCLRRIDEAITELRQVPA